MRIQRRTFLKFTAAMGAAAAVGMNTRLLFGKGKDGLPYYIDGASPDPVETDPDVEIKYSICLQCHSGCGIRYKIVDGRLVKIDGNPYHPNVMEPHIPYETDPAEARRFLGSACLRGQAGVQTLYDPLRIKNPLKRVGPRGSGTWKSISWDQALTEIIEGGDLFGEGHVDGLRAIRDLETPIDPEAPELGPRANQLVLAIGRAEHGRKEFTDRFFKDAFGTINYRHEHTSICELSHHIGIDLIFHKKHHYKPDILNSRYIIWFGTRPTEANFPMQSLARKISKARVENKLKMVVVDPIMSTTGAIADEWIASKPGSDAALAMGMIQWMIENGRYDKTFLENTTEEAAKKDRETVWTNSSYLVRLDNRMLLRADEAGIAGGTKEQHVVISAGAPAAHDAVEHGELDVEMEVNGIPCKSAFRLLREAAYEKTLHEFAEICGIEKSVIERLADEFTSHGKRAVADFYRGPVQHSNGCQTARAITALNLMIGNINWKGGVAFGGGHWHEMGGKPGNPYNLEKELHPGKVKATGVPVSREKSRYEDSTEFKKKGYPARRPWFPFTSNVWQEVFAGIASQYPYPTKALILLKANPIYSVPGSEEVRKALLDREKVPLLVAFDIIMGETSALADYILPDRTFLEQYSTTHVAPAILTKTSAVRIPFGEPVIPESRLIEDVFIEIAKRMNLPGFGDDGFGPGDPLNTAWDWYRKLFANIAYGDKENEAVPGATEDEKIQYIIARGGRFEDYRKAYDGEYLAHRYKGICEIYNEHLATTRDSITGEYFSGVPRHEPITDARGKPVQDTDHPYQLITYKLVQHTQSRTMANPWLVEIKDENYVEISTADAEWLRIKQGDKVRVSSATSKAGVVGKALIREGLRPGVVAISHHYGHWEYGTSTYTVDGVKVPYDPRRGGGISPNPIMRVDTSIGNVGIQDKIGGSASFYDTWVKVEKV